MANDRLILCFPSFPPISNKPTPSVYDHKKANRLKKTILTPSCIKPICKGHGCQTKTG